MVNGSKPGSGFKGEIDASRPVYNWLCYVCTMSKGLVCYYLISLAIK